MSFRISIIYIVSLLLSFALHAGEALLNGHKKNGTTTFELAPTTINQLIQVSLAQYTEQANMVKRQGDFIEQQALSIKEKDKQLEARLKDLAAKDMQREEDAKKIRNLRLFCFTTTLLSGGLFLERIARHYPDLLSKLGTLLISKSPPSAG